MPDEDDRFSDIAEQLQQTEAQDDGVDSEDGEQTPSDEGSIETVDREPDSTEEQTDPNDSEPGEGPAFAFDDTDMHGFYVRSETWEGITRMRSSVTAACSMFDVPEFEGREFQDACLQVVANHGDEVALQILRERGIEADEARVQEVVEMLSDQADR